MSDRSTSAHPGSNRRLRRPGKRGLLLLIALVLFPAVIAAGDRVSASVVTRRLSADLACATGTQPQLQLSSVPLLPHLATGGIGRVEAHLDRYGTHGTVLTGITVHAENVDLPGPRGQDVGIGALDVRFDVPLDLLPSRVDGHDLRYTAAGDGLLAVRTTADVAGIRVPITVLARPGLDGNRIALTAEQVEVLGLRRPVGALAEWFAEAAPPRELPALPDGLAYRTVAVTETGLRFEISGTHLHVPVPADRQHCR
jgi:hypothetical protein